MADRTTHHYKITAIIFTSIICISIIYAIDATLLNATYASAYECGRYSIDVPDSYTVDDTSLTDCVTFRNDTDNITLLIRTENNLKGEDVSTYTESHINDLINDTISSLDTKGASKASSPSHSITSFASAGYPALYITYEGNGDKDSAMYMEEYIITTTNYIYTLVFSADSSMALAGSDADTIKAGFTANDSLIVHSMPADNTDVMYLFTGLCVVVLATGAFIIIRIIRKSSRDVKHR